MKKCVLSILISCTTLNAEAAPIEWMQTRGVKNFNQAIAGIQAKNTSQLPLYFPRMIPTDESVTYYANYDVNASGYNLYIDSSKTCNGAHYCNIITMNASNVAGTLPVYKNMQGKVMTVTQKLDNGIVGSYTPGFAMGDYWNPQVAWQENKLTYTISWVGVQKPDETRWAMLNMVNNLQTYKSAGNS